MTLKWLIWAGLLLAVAVGITGTVVSGRYCTAPDTDGCQDERTGEETYFDDDRYGWPVRWRSDFTLKECKALECGNVYLVDPYGVSWVKLPISVAAWAFFALTGEAMLVLAWFAVRYVATRRGRAVAAPG
ncbi:MAG: hypothetical protein WEE64_08475 [Dehalococcoidia bacterium]